MLKHLRRRPVRRRLRHNRNRQTPHAETVQDDGRIVQVLQDVHAKGVDQAVADEDGGVDPQRLACCGHVSRLDGCRGGDEAGAAEADACCYCELAGRISLRQQLYVCIVWIRSYLPNEIEPPRYPRQKRRMSLRRQRRGPEVWAPAGGNGGDDFGHAEADDEGHEGDCAASISR